MDDWDHIYEVDGYVTNEPGVPIVVFTADCVPVLLEDSKHGVIGALHCGWRSTVADIEKEGEYTVYWEIESEDDDEIVVIFRSYTGALIRYYIEPVSGDTYVTEYVPGITSEEQKTDEQFNIRNYVEKMP